MSETEEGVRSARLFIALAVPAAVQARLGVVQKELSDRLQRNEIRWVRPDQIHLTLKFLGNVALDRIQELTSQAKEACKPFTQLELRAKGIGFFPSERRPRVMWASVEDKTGNLEALQGALEDSTATFTPGVKRERFVGHLTIGRVKAFRPRFSELFHEKVRVLQGTEFGEWKADSIEIIRSELSENGSKYFRVADLALEGSREQAA